ncbi:MAG: hypothetical protein ACE362_05995 [Phaeodactylibacter xiamenensis]|uniref:hypothetical protein n=1 Tax=Phaeodactylibacter xiamenensis TaxID=1524460 RepID=UPI000696F1D6|nr:hypothetical protein [Phaeodactylibacter xiamenensis]MCR9050229.1 hypothetical protein [bacterium]
MDHQLIRQLLDRYFEGQTSLEEEAQLRRAFQRKDLPEDLKGYRPLFGYLEQNAAPELGDAFDAKLLAELQPQEAKVRYLSARTWGLRIAAAVALAIGAFWMYEGYQPAQHQEVAGVDWSKYEVEDPKQAFAITSSALKRASLELNQGTDVAAQGFERNLKEISRFFE